MRRPKALKAFRVYFAEVVGCATISASSAKEAKTIAQDHYDRGELTTENMDGIKLLPEGRAISAEFYQQGDNPPFIYGVEEEDE